MTDRTTGIAASLRRARTGLGLSADAVAQRTGLSVNELYDVETYDDEIGQTISLSRVVALLRLLQLNPYDLFKATPTSDQPIGVEGLRVRLLGWLESYGTPIDVFEDDVGWEVRAALRDPAAFRTFNLQGLRDVASRLGVEWVDVIASEIAQCHSTPTS